MKVGMTAIEPTANEQKQHWDEEIVKIVYCLHIHLSTCCFPTPFLFFFVMSSVVPLLLYSPLFLVEFFHQSHQFSSNTVSDGTSVMLFHRMLFFLLFRFIWLLFRSHNSVFSCYFYMIVFHSSCLFNKSCFPCQSSWLFSHLKVYTRTVISK